MRFDFVPVLVFGLVDEVVLGLAFVPVFGFDFVLLFDFGWVDELVFGSAFGLDLRFGLGFSSRSSASVSSTSPSKPPCGVFP